MTLRLQHNIKPQSAVSLAHGYPRLTTTLDMTNSNDVISGIEASTYEKIAKLLLSFAQQPAIIIYTPYLGATMDFPNTDDGEILREMHKAGMDLGIARNIDFFVNFGKKRDAEKMQAEVESNGTEAIFSLNENETHDGWILCCTIAMVPRHDDIIEVERAFDKIAATHQGESDGWGVLQPEG